ncbi:MAG: hypothetical protein ABTQ32_05515 [Myxococcaceae bacterium]
MLRPALALAVAALLGCPQPMMMTPDAGPIDAGVTLSPTEACDRLAAAKCALKKRCYVAFQREDDSACTQNEQARCLGEYATLQQSFDRELVKVDPTKISACEKRMTSSACPPTFPPDYPGAVARPFADCTFRTGLLTGFVPAGETCVNAQECVAGTVCIKPNGVCRGVCSSSPKQGDPCAFGCGPGLVCGKDGKCAPLKPLDTPCDVSTECETDLICVGGTCRPRRKLGDSCQFDPSVPSTCEPGLACDVVPYVDGATGTCVRPQGLDKPCRFHWSCESGLLCSDINWAGFPSSAPTAGTCRSPDDLDTACRGSTYAVFVGEQCKAGASCDLTMQLCKATPTRGQACKPSRNDCTGVDTYCKPSGSGDTGTCTGPAALNEPCAVRLDPDTTVSIPCATGWCDTTNTFTCRPPSKALGTLCTQDAECMSGRCAVQQDRTLKCTEAC